MKTLLVDGPNLGMRAVKAVTYGRVELSADGVNTGPLVIFVNTLTRHVREERPDRVMVLWDGGRSDRRLEIDPQYKAHRLAMAAPEQEVKDTTFALLREFLTLAGVPHVERRGFEADDLIAHYWARSQPGEHVVILSSDKDFLQLLEDEPRKVEQVRVSSGDAPTDRWDARRVEQDLGIPPVHLAKAMALAGDASDGVPGIPRFGMKTAVKHLARAGWDLDAIEHPTVVEHRDRVAKNLSLVDLRLPTDLQLPPLPSFLPTTPGSLLYPGLVQFLSRYRLRAIQQRFYDHTLWSK